MSEQETTSGQISAQWLTSRLRGNGHLAQGKVLSANITAHHKHHVELEVAYSADAPGDLPHDLILNWESDTYFESALPGKG